MSKDTSFDDALDAILMTVNILAARTQPKTMMGALGCALATVAAASITSEDGVDEVLGSLGDLMRSTAKKQMILDQSKGATKQ